MDHGIRLFIAAIADSSVRPCEPPSVVDHALLGHGSTSWRESVEALTYLKLLWLAMPIAVLDGSVLNIKPHVEEMADHLYGASSWTTDDVAQLRRIVKRVRSYLTIGRRVRRLPHGEFAELFRGQNGRCALCGYAFHQSDVDASEYLDEPASESQIGTLRPPHVDHTIPLFLGGDSWENKRILCHLCNLSKGAAFDWFAARCNLGPSRPSDLTTTSYSERWAVLARDRRCSHCSTRPYDLPTGVELTVRRTDPRRGWLIENMRATCTSCDPGAGSVRLVAPSEDLGDDEAVTSL